MELDTQHIFGFDFVSDNTYEHVLNKTLSYDFESSRLPFFITPNTDQIVKFNQEENAEIATVLKNSFIVLPDGNPIVWSSRLLKKPLKSRLTGSDFFNLNFEHFKMNTAELLFVVANNEVKEHLTQLGIRSYVPPFFRTDETSLINSMVQDITTLIEQHPTRFVFMGIGCPKQEFLSIAVYQKLKEKSFKKIPLFLLLGASYEFHFQLRKRAPKFYQKLGLEFLHRIFLEPKRMFKRYFIDDLSFLKILYSEWRKS